MIKRTIIFAASIMFLCPCPHFSQEKSKYTAISNIPDHVVYEFYFRRTNYINNKHQKQGNGILASELGLTDSDEQFMKGLISSAITNAANVDNNAAVIIKSIRDRYPNGVIMGEPPAVPTELIVLQAERDKIFTDAKTKMSEHFGASAFHAIDSIIKFIISPGIKQLSTDQNATSTIHQ